MELIYKLVQVVDGVGAADGVSGVGDVDVVGGVGNVVVVVGGGAGGRGEEMRAKWDYRLPSYEIFPPQITNLSHHISAVGEICRKWAPRII